MQLKYSFKKEWMHFVRTFRFWGVLIAIVGFSLCNPLMFKFTGVVMEQMSQTMNDDLTAASISIGDGTEDIGGSDLFGRMDFGSMAEMYSDAGMMFSTTLTSLASYALLVIMLVLMSAAGGEQKKRAMVIPTCSGLQYNNYLLPKFIIYPLVVFVETFVCGMATGAFCNALFPLYHVSIENITLASLLIAVYMTFILSVFLSLGLCTSRPGIMTPVVFLGQMILQSILEGFGLSDYHPFTLLTMLTEIGLGDFVLKENLASLVTALVLSVVIIVLMYFLALGVLKAKKVDNQAEEQPEF